MTLPTGSPRILLVGAYERDNFGDLLFLCVTERYLGGAEIVAAAPFPADMTDLLGRKIPAHGPLVERERFDAIWTVGGQIGAIDVGHAFHLSASPDNLRAYQARPRFARRLALDAFRTGPSPYIAPLTGRNADAIRIVNSAGLSGISDIEPRRRARVLELLRAQHAITVRDKASSRYLDRVGIRHELAPDAVHAISVTHPLDRDPDSDVGVVQTSARFLAEFGVDRVAQRLAASDQLRDCRIRLVPAGTANGHDSLEDYEALVVLARRHRPGIDIEIFEDRRPLRIAEVIGRARVAIGTSLHLRIVAAAYEVPRVNFARPKVTRYARSWDPAMPFGVALPDLDNAIESAVSIARRSRERDRASGLTIRAHQQLVALAVRARTAPARAVPEPAWPALAPEPA